MKKPLILLTAGGTGGHVFPAEALATELTKRGHKLAFVTDKRGAAYGGALGGLDTYHISGGGIAGKSPFKRLHSVGSLVAGYFQARKLIRRLKPAAVIGFGGYASVPAVMAANHLGVPSAVHEQNAVLGRANRLLAGGAARIATSFERTGRVKAQWHAKLRHVGNPVRAAILALRGAPYPARFGHGPITLLVVGGSQGAKAFSELVPQALIKLPHDLQRRLSVHQQCKIEDVDRVTQLYHHHGIAADLRPFFDDIPARLAEAHLVICRSGASTVAELAAAGRPAVLIPYPHAIDDHQTANAAAFARRGAGWLMPQATLTPDSLAVQLGALLAAPGTLEEAARHAEAEGHPQAAERLADLMGELSEGALS
ncbi:MAG TPA: undecaprenyldiphospho-muramoylpentapeptide beta-N-acetylglucosaminyltransferase [Magnetospirillaceae bacterium]|nr:undecaprenyldiphospho-muramoylpentapeptide beta-N-acetylglucosaminyltransferase [Magnetospirillaceae bacterium]